MLSAQADKYKTHVYPGYPGDYPKTAKRIPTRIITDPPLRSRGVSLSGRAMQALWVVPMKGDSLANRMAKVVSILEEKLT